jgi:hypothetical protein
MYKLGGIVTIIAVCRLIELVLLLQLLRRNVRRTVGPLFLCSQAENAKVYEVWPSTALQTTLQTAQLAKLRFKEMCFVEVQFHTTRSCCCQCVTRIVAHTCVRLHKFCISGL